MNNTPDTLAALMRSENIILKNALNAIENYIDEVPKDVNPNHLNKIVNLLNKVFAVLETTNTNIEDIENTIERVIDYNEV